MTPAARLVERLRAEADKHDAIEYPADYIALLREAADALEASERDAQTVRVPRRRLESFAAWFDTAGTYGVQEKYEDGRPTPNATGLLDCAKEIRAMLSAAPAGGE